MTRHIANRKICLRYNQKAFTLIELIIVIVIIGILATISVSIMQQMKTRAMVTEALNGMAVIRASLQQYCAENGQYLFSDPWYSWGIPLAIRPQYFPGISLRSGSTPGTLDGIYFSQECYGISAYKSPNPPAIFCYPAGDAAANIAPKKDDAISTTDTNNSSYAYLVLYLKTGKIKQQYWPNSGYPVDNGSPD